MAINIRNALLLVAVFCFLAVGRASAQKPGLVEDPEDDKKLGLWLDQGLSYGLTPGTSLEFEAHQRSDEDVSNFYEYFFQGGVAFRVRPWLTITPSYRYQRYPGNPAVNYENRLLVNATLATSRGPWRPNLRVLFEGRFPDDRIASARIRIRPGIEYRLPVPMKRQPVLVASNEFFLVPGTNSFAAGGSFTQNRFQIGVRFPITDTVSVRPYYLLQSVNLSTGWDTNEIIGLSMTFKLNSKTK
jgi:hypothetical protein